jgi:hypothetical protein
MEGVKEDEVRIRGRGGKELTSHETETEVSRSGEMDEEPLYQVVGLEKRRLFGISTASCREGMPRQALRWVRKLAFRREETQVVQRRARMGGRDGDFDQIDEREGGGKQTIGPFPGSGMDVVRRDPDGDGDDAEASEFVSLSGLTG